MKHKPQILAEHNASGIALEQQYSLVSEAVFKAMQKGLQIRSAILNMELKLQNAVAEFEEELTIINENFRDK